MEEQSRACARPLEPGAGRGDPPFAVAPGEGQDGIRPLEAVAGIRDRMDAAHEELAQRVGALSGRVNRYRVQIGNLIAQGPAPGGSRQMQRILSVMAADYRRLAGFLIALQRANRELGSALAAAVGRCLDVLPALGPAERAAQAGALGEQIRSYLAAAQGTLDQLQPLRGPLGEMAAARTSRDLDHAVRQLAHVLDATIADLDRHMTALEACLEQAERHLDS